MLKSDSKENLLSNQQTTMEILVIDDNLLLINLLAKSLIQDGIGVTSVTNIEDAIKLLKGQIFDAVLYDGPIDGYSKEAILELFDKNNFFQDQRIVLFSGVTQPDFIQKWKTKGLYSYIEKPTSTQKILEFLQVIKNDPRPKKILNSQTTQEQNIIEETTKTIEEEATPEQLTKVEELTKQIEELELQSAKPTSSQETIQKPELVLKQDEAIEEEATPEQLTKVEELTKQIEELELQSAKPTSSQETIQKPELVLKQDEAIEEEATPEQLTKVEELTKQIEELEIDYDYQASENIKQDSIENSPDITFEAYSNNEFTNILSRLSSIKNQFLYNTSNVSNINQIQTTEDELFNLKKEIAKVRRKVYRSRSKQKNTKSTSTQKKRSKKQRTPKKKRK